VGTDGGLNRSRAQAISCDTFVDKYDTKGGSMSHEDLITYAKSCRDGWCDVLTHEAKGT
jgi:hypothetical protein